MKKWKKVKRSLKTNKSLKTYNKKFKNNQIRFAISKIATIYNSEVDIKILESKEEYLLKVDKGEKMFEKVFSDFEKITKTKADWLSFSKFMWFQYQVSTYNYDKKKNIKNIFDDNIIKRNETKRKLYLNWLHSIDKKDMDFNEKIIKTAKVVW